MAKNMSMPKSNAPATTIPSMEGSPTSGGSVNSITGAPKASKSMFVKRGVSSVKPTMGKC